MEVDRAKQWQRKRRLMHGGNALVLTISVVGLMILAYVGIARLQWRVDLTAHRMFTLSGQTVEVLESLQGPVVIRAFFRRHGDVDQVFIRRKVDDVLREYTEKSSQIDYKMLDPDLHSEELMAYDVQSDGVIVFLAGDRRKEVNQTALFNYRHLGSDALPQFVGESLFTNAILGITQKEQRFVCLLTGHGERAADDRDVGGLSALVLLMKRDNYRVETVSMQVQADWVQLCDVLVIAGPRLGFHEAEDEAIAQYVASGKGLVLLVDPHAAADLQRTLGQFNVAFHDSVVFDPNRHFIAGTHYPAPIMKPHEITDSLLEAGLTPIFQLARPLLLSGEAEGETYQLEGILLSSPVAWGETNLAAGEEVKQDPGQDLAGPLSLGVAVTRRDEHNSLQPAAVIFGDSDFITNGLIELPGNSDLLLNSLAWLAGNEQPLAIRPQETDFRPLLLEPIEGRWVVYFSQIIYPGLILFGGLGYWWRRRRR